MTPRKPRLAVDNDAEKPIDIYAAIRAKRESIDWARVHITADRRAPVCLPDRVKRGWR